ncbi:hypothetical protein [Paenibacillus terrigena]|uniref:hypothetical protein n=1 Tax=Paenibacillus terrigena TaxID=369333 RepID=UPI00035EC081|nr:hypothetical protein [Paenibacillus terrigena]
MEFNVTVELIPETSIYDNLRKVVKKSVWDKLRKQTYKDYNHSCGKCGGKEGILDCHELWEFDDKKNIQKLSGLVAVCRMCHLIIHHGRANMLVAEGVLDKEELIKHFLKVNHCTRQDYEIHVKEAFVLWKQRSQKEWVVDLGEYQQYTV